MDWGPVLGTETLGELMGSRSPKASGRENEEKILANVVKYTNIASI